MHELNQMFNLLVNHLVKCRSVEMLANEPLVKVNLTLAHNWAVHMHSPNVVSRTDFEGHTTSGVNNL